MGISKSESKRLGIQRGIPEATPDDLKLDLEARYHAGIANVENIRKVIRLAAHWKRELDISFLDADAEEELYDKQTSELEADRDRYKAWEYTGNLLARIHRDGGHYISKHGIRKATKDAEVVVLAERDHITTLEAALRELRGSAAELMKLLLGKDGISRETLLAVGKLHESDAVARRALTQTETPDTEETDDEVS